MRRHRDQVREQRRIDRVATKTPYVAPPADELFELAAKCLVESGCAHGPTVSGCGARWEAARSRPGSTAKTADLDASAAPGVRYTSQ
jgi:hypothetical protein